MPNRTTTPKGFYSVTDAASRWVSAVVVVVLGYGDGDGDGAW